MPDAPRLKVRRRAPVNPERERHLAPVMQVVFEQVPDDPVPGDLPRLVWLLAWVRLLPLGRRPAGDGFLHEARGSFQPPRQFGRAAHGHARAVPPRELGEAGGVFVDLHPAGAGADHVRDDLFNGSHVGGRSQFQLLAGQRSQGRNESRLIRLPACVDSGHEGLSIVHAGFLPCLLRPLWCGLVVRQVFDNRTLCVVKGRSAGPCLQNAAGHGQSVRLASKSQETRAVQAPTAVSDVGALSRQNSQHCMGARAHPWAHPRVDQ